MYCLFCVVLYIVCVFVCTEVLPPGGYPIAVKYIISYVHQNLRGVVLWVKKLFNVTVARRRLGGIHYDSALTKDAACFSETLAPTYQTTTI